MMSQKKVITRPTIAKSRRSYLTLPLSPNITTSFKERANGKSHHPLQQPRILRAKKALTRSRTRLTKTAR